MADKVVLIVGGRFSLVRFTSVTDGDLGSGSSFAAGVWLCMDQGWEAP